MANSTLYVLAPPLRDALDNTVVREAQVVPVKADALLSPEQHEKYILVGAAELAALCAERGVAVPTDALARYIEADGADLSLAAKLLDAGASPDVPVTPKLVARDELVAYLLDPANAHAGRCSATERQTFVNAVLLEAVKQGRAGTVASAIKNGADVHVGGEYICEGVFGARKTIKIKSEMLPLIAICKGNIEVLKLLVQAGCDVNSPSIVKVADSIIVMAMAHNRMDMVQFLVESGADINQANNIGPGVPLRRAIRMKKYAVARYLISKGATLSIGSGGINIDDLVDFINYRET